MRDKFVVIRKFVEVLRNSALSFPCINVLFSGSLIQFDSFKWTSLAPCSWRKFSWTLTLFPFFSGNLYLEWSVFEVTLSWLLFSKALLSKPSAHFKSQGEVQDWFPLMKPIGTAYKDVEDPIDRVVLYCWQIRHTWRRGQLNHTQIVLSQKGVDYVVRQ